MTDRQKRMRKMVGRVTDVDLAFDNSTDIELSGMNINSIDDHCLDIVLGFLPIRDRVRSERVCKRWRDVIAGTWRKTTYLSMTRRIWGEMDESTRIDQRRLDAAIARCGRYLRGLCTCDVEKILERKMKFQLGELIVFCRNLTYLDISEQNIDIALARAIGSSCKLLESISIGDPAFGFDERHLVEMIIEMPSLTYLSTRCMFHVNWGLLDWSSAARITALRLEYAVNTDRLQDTTLSEMSSGMRNFRNLCVRGALDVSTLERPMYLQSFGNLMWLDLSFNPECIADRHIQVIAEYCGNLRGLEVQGNFSLNDSGMLHLAGLDSLWFLNISDTALSYRCILSIRSLITIVCCACSDLTGDSYVDFLRCMPRLEHLEMPRCRYYPQLYGEVKWSNRLISILRRLGYDAVGCKRTHR